MGFAGVSGGVEKFSDIGAIISNLLEPIFALAGMIALLILIWGGIRYMTARGDPKAHEAARGTITGAVIGLLIVIFAAAIFYIFSTAFKITIFGQLFSTKAYAVNIGDQVTLGGGSLGSTFSNVGELFTNLVRVALAVAALVFLAMMVWGGFRYLSAGGDPKNADAARSTLTNAGVGLLIVVTSFIIIEIISRATGVASIF